MSNMTYCRFSNTRTDLQDCYEAWNDNEDTLSPGERQARKRILALCQKIVDEYGDDE